MKQWVLPRVFKEGVRNAWNYLDRDSGISLIGCASALVAQQRLGLLSVRWRGSNPRDCRYSSATWPDLTDTVASCRMAARSMAPALGVIQAYA